MFSISWEQRGRCSEEMDQHGCSVVLKICKDPTAEYLTHIVNSFDKKKNKQKFPKHNINPHDYPFQKKF